MNWPEIRDALKALAEIEDELREQQRAADGYPGLGPPDLFSVVEQLAQLLPPSLWRTCLEMQARVYGEIVRRFRAWGQPMSSRFPTPKEREKYGATLVVYFNGEMDG